MSVTKKETAWVVTFANIYLKKVDRSISNLCEFSTGVELFFLLKSMIEEKGGTFKIFNKMETKKIRMEIVQKSNVQNILAYLQEQNIPTFGINAGNIVKKDEKIMYHVKGSQAQDSGVTKNKFSKGTFKFKKKNPYVEIVEFVNNFVEIPMKPTSSTEWSKGKPLFDFVKGYATKYLPKEKCKSLEKEPTTPKQYIDEALEFSEEHFGIPMLISSEMFLETPDKLSLTTYLSFFRNLVTNLEKERLEEEVNKLNVEIKEKDKAKEEIKVELNVQIQEKEKIKKEMGKEIKKQKELLSSVEKKKKDNEKKMRNIINVLQGELEKMEFTLIERKRVMDENEDLHKKVERLEEENKDLAERSNTQVRVLKMSRDSVSKIEELEKTVRNVEVERETIQSKLQTDKEKLVRITFEDKERIEILEKEIQDLKEELEKSKGKKKLQKKVKKLKKMSEVVLKEKEELFEEKKTVENQNKKLIIEKDKVEKELKKKEEINSNLLLEKRGIEAKHQQEIQEIISKANIEIFDPEEIAKMEEKTTETLAKMIKENKETYKKDYKALPDSTKKTVDGIATHISKHYNQELNEKKKAITRLETSINGLEKDIVVKEGEISQLKDDINAKNALIQKNQELINEKERKIQELLEAIQKETNEEKKQKLIIEKNSLSTEVEELKENVDKWGEDIAKEWERLKNLEKEFEVMKVDLEDRKTELVDAQSKAKQLKKMLSCVQKESLYSVAKTDIKNIASVVFKHAKYSTESGRSRIKNEINNTKFFTENVETSPKGHLFLEYFGSMEFEKEKKYTLILEKCDFDLMSFVRKKKPSLKNRLQLLRDTALGMSQIHKNEMVHLDLKPENVFVKIIGGNPIIKLADFEEVRKVTKEGYLHKHEVGTYNYMDHKILTLIGEGKPDMFLKKRDVYSYGVVVFCLVYMKIPFSIFMKKVRRKDRNFQKTELPRTVRKHLEKNEKETVFSILVERCKPKDEIPEEIIELIKRCTHKNEEQRPSFEEIVKLLDSVLTKTEDVRVFPTELREGELDEIKKELEKKKNVIVKIKEKMKNVVALQKKKSLEVNEELAKKNEVIQELRMVISEMKENKEKEQKGDKLGVNKKNKKLKRKVKNLSKEIDKLELEKSVLMIEKKTKEAEQKGLVSLSEEDISAEEIAEMEEKSTDLVVEMITQNKEHFKKEYKSLPKETKQSVNKMSKSINSHFSDEVKEKEKQIGILEGSILVLEKDINLKESEISQLKDHIKAKNDQISKSQLLIKEKERRIQELLEAIQKETNAEKKQQLINKKNSLNAEVEGLKENVDKWSEAIAKEWERLKKLEKEFEVMKINLEGKKTELVQAKSKAKQLKKMLSCVQKESLYSVAKTDIKNVASVVFKHAKYSTESGRNRIKNEIENTKFFTENIESTPKGSLFLEYFGSMEFEKEKKFTLILEKCDFDLMSFVRKKKPSLKQRLELLRDTALGMKLVHQKNLAHLDIKPENVFVKIVGGVSIVKLADFEEVKKVTKEGYVHKHEVGTYNYMDYNILKLIGNGEPDVFLKKRDVYSFGIVLFCLSYVKIPFSIFMKKARRKDKTFQKTELPRAIRIHLEKSENETVFSVLSERCRPKDKIPDEVIELIKSCTHKDEKSRPTFEEVEKVLDGILKEMDDIPVANAEEKDILNDKIKEELEKKKKQISQMEVKMKKIVDDQRQKRIETESVISEKDEIIQDLRINLSEMKEKDKEDEKKLSEEYKKKITEMEKSRVLLQAKELEYLEKIRELSSRKTVEEDEFDLSIDTKSREKVLEIEEKNTELVFNLIHDNKKLFQKEYSELGKGKKKEVNNIANGIRDHYASQLKKNEKEMENLKKQIQKLNEKVSQKEGAISSLKDKIDTREKEIREREDIISKKKKKIEDLTKIIESKKKPKQSILNERNTIAEQIATEGVALSKLKISQENDMAKLSVFEQEYSKLKNELESTKMTLKETESTNNQLKKMLTCIQKDSLYSVAKTDIRKIANVVFKQAKYTSEKGRERILNEIQNTQFFTSEQFKTNEESEKTLFLKYFGSMEYKKEKKFTLILEKCEFDLMKFVRVKKPSLKERLRILKDVAVALGTMHANKKCHLDIKAENVFISNNVIKIADFEEVRRSDKPYVFKHEIGTFNYMDPNILELIQEQKPDEFLTKRDVYSYGILLFCLSYLKIPFSIFMKIRRRKDRLFQKIELPKVIRDHLKENEKDNVLDLLKMKMSKKKSNVPESVDQIIRECTQRDSSKRPDFSVVVEKLNHILQNENVDDTKTVVDKNDDDGEIKKHF